MRDDVNELTKIIGIGRKTGIAKKLEFFYIKYFPVRTRVLIGEIRINLVVAEIIADQIIWKKLAEGVLRRNFEKGEVRKKKLKVGFYRKAYCRGNINGQDTRCTL